MIKQHSRSLRRLGLIVSIVSLALGLCGTVSRADLIFHSTMDSAAEIEVPAINQGVYSPTSDAIPGPQYIEFVPGRFGTAVSIDNGGGLFNGPIHFKGANFDFVDPDQDGGRLDVWLRFDEDPHEAWGPWVLRSNWPTRRINFEITDGKMMLDVYGEVPNNERTNYQKFRVVPSMNSSWGDISVGEWHLFTFRWRNNGDVHKDEIHYYIDGAHIGSDYNGNLPTAEQFNEMYLSPLNGGNEINFTIDEIYSFDSWNVSGATGNFADISFPEGVTLTYPMDGRYPVWGSPVTLTNVITFEFFVINDQSQTCECDLYVDDSYVGSMTATSFGHSEITRSQPLPNGTHTYQVKCDEDRLISPVNQFNVDFDGGTPVHKKTFGSFKRQY